MLFGGDPRGLQRTVLTMNNRTAERETLLPRRAHAARYIIWLVLLAVLAVRKETAWGALPLITDDAKTQ